MTKKINEDELNKSVIRQLIENKRKLIFIIVSSLVFGTIIWCFDMNHQEENYEVITAYERIEMGVKDKESISILERYIEDHGNLYFKTLSVFNNDYRLDREHIKRCIDRYYCDGEE